MKKNEIIKAWKSKENKEEISNIIGLPEVNKEVVKGGESGDSAGFICSVSGECFFGISCNPFHYF